MDKKSVMDAMMGQEMPSADSRAKIAELATRFAQLQDGQSFAALMQAVGAGTMGVGALAGSPVIAGVGGGLALAGASADRGFDRRKGATMNEMDTVRAPYPGVYRTPF